MNTLFGSAPLGLVEWVETIAVGLIVLPVISLEKWIRKRQAQKKEQESDPDMQPG